MQSITNSGYFDFEKNDEHGMYFVTVAISDCGLCKTLYGLVEADNSADARMKAEKLLEGEDATIIGATSVRDDAGGKPDLIVLPKNPAVSFVVRDEIKRAEDCLARIYEKYPEKKARDEAAAAEKVLKGIYDRHGDKETRDALRRIVSLMNEDANKNTAKT